MQDPGHAHLGFPESRLLSSRLLEGSYGDMLVPSAGCHWLLCSPAGQPLRATKSFRPLSFCEPCLLHSILLPIAPQLCRQCSYKTNIIRRDDLVAQVWNGRLFALKAVPYILALTHLNCAPENFSADIPNSLSLG